MTYPIQQVQPANEQDDAIDLAKYLDFLIDNRWVIASVALVVTILGAAYALIANPIYEASILIQVEDSAGGNTGASKNNIQGDLSSVFDIRTATSSEIEVIRSRAVVARAVDNTRLYISVKPDYFPVVGAWMARRNKGLSEPGLFGYGGYVWGAEQADISTFNVPERLEGRRFVLTAEGNGNYRLTQEEEGIELRGRVGDTTKLQLGGDVLEIQVDRLLGKPGAQFFVTRAARLPTIQGLQGALTIVEKGKQSGIIGVTYEGADPKKTSEVLNEIGREYIRQNVDRKTEKAEKSLEFLDRQLPDLKQELERSENQYKEFRNRHGSVDIGEEGRHLLQQSVWTQTRLAELNQKKVEMLGRFEKSHPAIESVSQQISELNRQLAVINAKIKGLPILEQEIVRLNRNVKVNTELYTTLLGTAQQLRLASSSEIGNVRLLDTAAVPVVPIKPKRIVVIAISVIVGLGLGAAVAFVKKILSGRVDDPNEIEELLGLPVTATIPHSPNQQKLYSQVQSRTRKVSVLPQEAPFDDATESLRRFRTSLQFAMSSSRNNVIMITGPSPGVGKSFVSANFAAVLGAVGKKVLLIDADLRTGHLHRYFGLDRRQGLADAITAEAGMDNILHKDVVENVDFISTGRVRGRPAELLAHENFGRLLELFSTRYDVILIDTAPVLAVSDALVVASHAGIIFNIVRGGVSTVREIEETVKRFNQAGHTVTGVVFNGLKSRSARYGYGLEYEKYKIVTENH